MELSAAKEQSIAWFKLAEYVACGNKEYAVGIYKLLSRDFDSQALQHHLFADILGALGDHESATAQYNAAAPAYERNL